jgi:hypothetical protein
MFVRKVNHVEDLKIHSNQAAEVMIGCQPTCIVPSVNELKKRERHEYRSYDTGLLTCGELWARTGYVLSATRRSRTRSVEINLHAFSVEGKPELLSLAATRCFCIGRH